MHARFLNELALVADAGQISNQQDAQQKLGVNQRPTGLAMPSFNFSRTKLKSMCISINRSRWLSRSWSSSRKQ
jgi:hypothetical protein